MTTHAEPAATANATPSKSVEVEGKIWKNGQGGIVVMLSGAGLHRRFIVGESEEGSADSKLHDFFGKVLQSHADGLG